jgi:uncharacterized protein (TIGR03437 family)
MGAAVRRVFLGLFAITCLGWAQTPVVNSGGVVNTASYAAQGVAPGSIVSIFGTNLAGSPAANPGKIPLPTTLGDVLSVTFNGTAAPLFSVSPTQINAQLPWEVLPSGATSATVNVIVNRAGGSSQAQAVQVVPVMPGIFTASANGVGQAIATDNAGGAIAAPSGSIAGVNTHPIGIGSYLVIWCTGLGMGDLSIADGLATGGNIVNTTVKPAVLIGGVQATFVYSVLSPQYVGLYQIGVRVAPGTPTGNAVPLQIQTAGVTTSDKVTIAVAAGITAAGLFNTLTPATVSFTPSSSILPGLPVTTIATSSGTVSKDVVGYQGGDLVNGKVLYYPWAVTTGGASSISQAILSSVPHGVMLSYDASVSGFGVISNWKFFDMTTLSTPGGANAKGYNGAVIGSNQHAYLVPDGHKAGNLPTFVDYDTSKAVDDPTAYQTAGAPARGGSLGNSYGWCTGIFDGTYIYYVPGQDETTGLHGNVIRYNITTPFDLSTGDWAHFDMTSVDPRAEGFQSGAYDGHRFIYYVPFRGRVIVRYDTQYGTPGTPNPAGFTNPVAYKTLDPTSLGSPGFPAITGQGSPSELMGFTGAIVAWDASHTNEYLYLVPWATYPDKSGVPHLMSTTARVRIGTQTGTSWNYVDITGTDQPATASPSWEIFDLNTLTTNLQWQANGWPYPAVYQSGVLEGQSIIAGWQLGFISTGGAGPRVAFGANISQYWVEHDVGHALADATGWYLAQTPATLRHGTFGGAYDAVHHIFYPASPGPPLFQAAGL